MAHFCTDAKSLKNLVENEGFYGPRLVSMERFLRRLLSLLGLDYDVVFQPCEQELHRLRDQVYLRQFYEANKDVKKPETVSP